MGVPIHASLVSFSPSSPTPTPASPSLPYKHAGQIGLASVILTNQCSVLEDESALPAPLEPLHSPPPASGLVDVCSTYFARTRSADSSRSRSFKAFSRSKSSSLARFSFEPSLT